MLVTEMATMLEKMETGPSQSNVQVCKHKIQPFTDTYIWSTLSKSKDSVLPLKIDPRDEDASGVAVKTKVKF
jgi:hypothetical protein